MSAALFALKLIDALLGVAQLLPELRKQYEATRDALRTMISENRGPTAEEWAKLDSDTAKALAHLMAPK